MQQTSSSVGDRPLRILLWGTYDTGKPRVRLLRDGLLRNGAEIRALHVPLWDAIEDKSQVRGVSRWLKLALRAACAYPKLAWHFLRAPRPDVVLVAYPGAIDLFVLRLFAWMRRTPIAWDWFISAYDTVVLDRKIVSPRHPVAWTIRAVEWCAVRLADCVFMDTATHARRMERMFGLPHRRIGHVWVGAEAEAFAKDATQDAGDDARPFSVLFYGQFIPLHGGETIVEAASLLRNESIDWTLIGTGQEAPRLDAMLAQRALPRVHRFEWVPYTQLREMMAHADVVLGIFGTSEKAASVIPNKVFQAVMARRPLITRDSPALREFLPDAPPFVQLIAAGNAAALATAVLLAREQLSRGAHTPDLALAAFDADAVGRQLLDLLHVTFQSPRIAT